MGLAILLSTRSCCRLSWDRWLHPLTCMDQFCWDVVDSSWLPFFHWLYCSLHFTAKDGVVIVCVSLGTVQYWWISIALVVVQLRAVFCPSVQYLPLFCEAFSWTILDSSHFPLFRSGQVFHQLVCPLTVVLPQIPSADTQHGNLYPAGWPVLFCEPTQEPVLATAYTVKNK